MPILVFEEIPKDFQGGVRVKRKPFLNICFLMILACGFLWAQTDDQEGSDEQASTNTEISIRFVERTTYYPGDSSSRPILVTFTITNNGKDTYRFKLADDHFFSLGFKAVTTRNIPLMNSKEWIRRRSTTNQIYFREISLESGESYSFIENIKDYLSLEEPGLYLLECSFFPELRRLPDYSENYIKSNRLTMEVKPEPSPAAASGYIALSEETGEILKPQPLPPDQVVSSVLSARQKSQWERFFLYLDIEEMINRDPVRKRRFQNESESGRFEMIENYKTELSQSRAENEISLVPSEFQIENTTYSGNEGTVTVIEWFDYITFKEKKRFTYYLIRRDNIWKICDYTVDNLGTE